MCTYKLLIHMYWYVMATTIIVLWSKITVISVSLQIWKCMYVCKRIAQCRYLEFIFMYIRICVLVCVCICVMWFLVYCMLMLPLLNILNLYVVGWDFFNVFSSLSICRKFVCWLANCMQMNFIYIHIHIYTHTNK